MRAKKSKGEEALAMQLKALKITGWVREYVFAPPRKWRADFAFPDERLLVEVEGGVWSGGRHNTGAGFVKDLEKYNAATLAKWAVLRFDTKAVTGGEAVRQIQDYLE